MWSCWCNRAFCFFSFSFSFFFFWFRKKGVQKWWSFWNWKVSGDDNALCSPHHNALQKVNSHMKLKVGPTPTCKLQSLFCLKLLAASNPYQILISAHKESLGFLFFEFPCPCHPPTFCYRIYPKWKSVSANSVNYGELRFFASLSSLWDNFYSSLLPLLEFGSLLLWEGKKNKCCLDLKAETFSTCFRLWNLVTRETAIKEMAVNLCQLCLFIYSFPMLFWSLYFSLIT